MNRSDLPVVVFDKDSTLADTRHRWQVVPPGQKPDWDAYSLACAGDTPLWGAVVLARLLQPGHELHVCSGSNAVARDATVAWMTRHRVPFDVLYQRPAGDRRPNWQLKVSYIRKLQDSGREVVLAVEDHPEVAEMITAETGVPVLGVNPFYPGSAAGLVHLGTAHSEAL